MMKKITPVHHFFDFNLAELYRSRQLLAVLVRRDLQVRYKNTALGLFWVIFQPLSATLIFALIFTQLFRFSLQQDNYLIYTLIGFIFWQFFVSCVTYASASVYEQISLIKKVYFPRLFLPLTVILRSLFDFCVSAVFLLVMMVFNHVPLSFSGFIGFFSGLSVLFIFACGISFISSSLHARYRDFRHLIPFVTQIWFYATPVFYPATLLSGPWAWLVTLNPVAQVLIFVRQAVFEQTLHWPILGLLLLISAIIFVLGLGIFKQMESDVVDWA